MVRPEVARQKVANALARLEQAETLVKGSSEGVPAAHQASDLASFYLLLAIQEAIDLAAHWVSDAGWIPPADAGGTFQLLAERGAIDPDLARGLRAAAALRNRIAHNYPSLDHFRLQGEFERGVATLRRFLAAVSAAAGI
jgi:uncharacterized protein YutE (UPF0331/DUF86 family)